MEKQANASNAETLRNGEEPVMFGKTMRCYLVLAAMTLACHALLPFCDYIVYDDVWTNDWIENQKLDFIYRIASEGSNNPYYYYYASLSVVPHLVSVMKTFAVVLTFLGAVLAYHLARRTRFFTAAECLVIAVIVISYPAYKVRGSVAYSNYLWPTVLFYGAALVALSAEETGGWRHLLTRLLALGMFLISFAMNSLLMFYGGFFLLLLIMEQRRREAPWYSIPWTYLLRRIDYLVAPFVYWTCKRILTPTHGFYATYNQLSWRAAIDWKAYWETIDNTIWEPLSYLTHATGTIPPVVFAVCAVALGLTAVTCLRTGAVTFRKELVSDSNVGWLAAFSVLLLFFSVFPYLAVGKRPQPWGMQTVYSALMPLPIGLLFVCVLRAARCLGSRAFVAVSVCMLVVVSQFVAIWWDNYLSLQALQVRNDSVVSQYGRLPQSKECSVVWISQDATVSHTDDSLHAWLWAYIAKDATNGVRTLGMQTKTWQIEPATPEAVRQLVHATTIGYSLTGVDPEGSQAMLAIRMGDRFNDPCDVAARYLFYRFFAPDEVPKFLNNLVEIEVATLRANGR